MPKRTAKRILAVAMLVTVTVGVTAVIALGGGSRMPMTSETLAASLSDEIGSGHIGEDGSCDRRGKTWRCEVADPGGSTVAEYDVSAVSATCWEATLRRFGERAPEAASGCVD